MGSLASIASESSSSPRNSRRVVGLTVFLGWNESPSAVAVFSIQSIAALAIWGPVEGSNLVKNRLGSAGVCRMCF